MARSQSGDIELDLGRYELRRAGHRIKLEKKPMELLIFLAGRREQLVSRQDIVSAALALLARSAHRHRAQHQQHRAQNPHALGDDAEKPRFLETVIGKGYRFVGPMRVISPLFPAAQSATENDAQPAAGAGKRSARIRWPTPNFCEATAQSTSGDPKLLEEAAQHLMNSLARDPGFALAHATLSFVMRGAPLRIRSQPQLAGEGGVPLPARFGAGCGSARRACGASLSALGAVEELPAH